MSPNRRWRSTPPLLPPPLPPLLPLLPLLLLLPPWPPWPFTLPKIISAFRRGARIISAFPFLRRPFDPFDLPPLGPINPPNVPAPAPTPPPLPVRFMALTKSEKSPPAPPAPSPLPKTRTSPSPRSRTRMARVTPVAMLVSFMVTKSTANVEPFRENCTHRALLNDTRRPLVIS